jgi:hypothetical protein
MPTLANLEQHPAVTDRNRYSYQFTPKHHGSDPGAAQWLPSLTLDEEFAVFNTADEHELADDRGWLYGIRPLDNGLQVLGTRGQQIAEFPSARAGEAWHGYPIWAVNNQAPSNIRGEKMRPDKEVFLKMERVGLLTVRQRKRLYKGDHV